MSGYRTGNLRTGTGVDIGDVADSFTLRGFLAPWLQLCQSIP